MALRAPLALFGPGCASRGAGRPAQAPVGGQTAVRQPFLTAFHDGGLSTAFKGKEREGSTQEDR